MNVMNPKMNSNGIINGVTIIIIVQNIMNSTIATKIS